MNVDKSSARNQRIYKRTLVNLRRLAWALNQHQTEVLDQVVAEAYNRQPADVRRLAEERFPDLAQETEQG